MLMISRRTAGNSLLVIFALLLLFHLTILVGIVPHDIVWAGKITSQEELVQFETVSMLILVVAILLVAMKQGYIRFPLSEQIGKVGVWLLFFLFVLNSIGNLFAPNPIERYGFGLLTIVIALLCFHLATGFRKKRR
ncbi:hypothetical protein R9C00_04465 [Flammeovirgaceae bacterium SG7u.111]|nr:hypothetical protein [Flammeovirgaceae bacterium SG7u.132]WPO36700.1 hypothetical protein R9C00_04465 [Flammeovirgaceae bacterium SG7u.111]